VTENKRETSIVGFSTTTSGPTSTQIKSIQFLYYSTDQNVCTCLLEAPTVSQMTEIEGKVTQEQSFFEHVIYVPKSIRNLLTIIIFVFLSILTFGSISVLLVWLSNY
jgi:hypothetical protein